MNFFVCVTLGKTFISLRTSFLICEIGCSLSKLRCGFHDVGEEISTGRAWELAATLLFFLRLLAYSFKVAALGPSLERRGQLAS